MSATPRRGIVVEDLPDTRDWLADVLRAAFPGIEVHTAETLAEGRALCTAHPPEVALVDLGLPDGSGIELIAALASAVPDCAPVVSTVYGDDEHVFAALRAGAQGYLLKDQPRDRLAQQLRGMLQGEPPLSPAIARRLMRFFAGAPRPASRTSGLTERELEVLELIAKGHVLKDVATALGISRHTVGDHVKSIYRKLNVASRAEAALEAARLGLLDD